MAPKEVIAQAIMNAGNGAAPRLTIGMPLYNDEEFVRLAIQSLLNQTFTGFRLIIGDNASTDQSVAIVRATAGDDPRVSVLCRPRNIGLVENLNSLAEMNTSEYYMWAASDDVWHPRFLQELIAALDAHPSAALAFGTYTFTDEAGIPYGGPRNFDFSGKTPTERIHKFAQMFDDGCFYGVYRTRLVGAPALPKWRGPNRVTPYNTAYPMLFGIFASGDMAFVSGEPLWLNRIKLHPRHPVPKSAHRLLGKLIYLLRQADLVEQSLEQIWRASRSPATTVRAILPLMQRFVRNLR